MVARWMVKKGARQLVLVGRNGPSPDQSTVIEELQRIGTEVKIAVGDVSRCQDVSRILTEEFTERLPLKGIIHAAGVLDDGALLQQTWERFSKVMAPKVTGAWNLHVFTKDIPLDFFILFSSATSMLGAPCQ